MSWQSRATLLAAHKHEGTYFISTVGCKRCDDLLANQKDAVSVFTSAGESFEERTEASFRSPSFVGAGMLKKTCCPSTEGLPSSLVTMLRTIPRLCGR